MKTLSKNPNRKTVKPVPEGFHTVTPFMVVDQASKLISFIEESFNGRRTSIFNTDDGKVMHATVRIGDSEIMIADEMEKFPAGKSKLYLYVDDVDATYKQAIDANAVSIREPTDEFYGDRSAGVRDFCGNEWWIATHTEDVEPEEMKRRQEKFMSTETAS